MYIDKYKADEYYSISGFEYEDPIEFIISGILDFDGSGEPKKVLEYILGSLKLIHNLSVSCFGSNEFDKWKEETRKYYEDNMGARYLMYYVLEKAGFIEFGTGLSGGWLTEKGKGILKDLEILIDE